MNKRSVIKVLRDHKAELKAAGVVHVRLFGSIARNEASAHSDVDLMVEFDKTKRHTLVSMGHLHSRLEDMLGARVDLSSYDSMREPIRQHASREAILAF